MQFQTQLNPAWAQFFNIAGIILFSISQSDWWAGLLTPNQIHVAQGGIAWAMLLLNYFLHGFPPPATSQVSNVTPLKAAAVATLVFLSAALMFPGAAHAADQAPPKATKAAPVPYADISNGYTTTGVYFGVNVLGGAGGVQASGAGVNPNSVTSTEFGAGVQVGWAQVLNPNLTVAVEALFDIDNFNGAAAGFSLGGPWALEQRVKIISPLANVISWLPGNPFAALTVPPFSPLPNGQVASNIHPYFMFASHEDAVGLNYGRLSNDVWQWSWAVGLGAMGQLTNGVAMDVWAEADFVQSSVCLSVPKTVCANQSTKYLVGTAFHF